MIFMQLPTYCRMHVTNYCRGYQGVAPEAAAADSSVGSDLSLASIAR